MPEIPGNSSIPGSGVAGGRVPAQPLGAGLAGPGGAGGTERTGGPGDDLQRARALKPSPRYFGFHTDASIMARLAAMGVSPTLSNLRVAQQLLRYGLGLNVEKLNEVAQTFSLHGQGDPSKLEAIVLLMARQLPVTNPNIQAMTQLLAGGPLPHLLARLTMAIKSENHPQLSALGQKLNGLWQLGHLDKPLMKQLTEFQRILHGISEERERLESHTLSTETRQELNRLGDLLEAHELLSQQQNQVLYLPFFIWRQQQPLPAEILITEEGGGTEHTSSFTKITLAVDTLTMGRVVVDLSTVRGHLSVRFDAPDTAVKKRIDPRLVALRQRLTERRYQVDILACQTNGPLRSICTLLPQRRDLKRLSRVQGVL
ncbi:MAG: hypothetical protein VKP62_07880 [Candidatus Sericytochromatia bacterium]|nr:hypothetical protein [Candidatus Sericytochromatia bacterium]